MFLVDSHCHLDYAAPEVRSEVIARARDAGVRTMLTISTRLGEFETIRSIAHSDPDIWCSVGVHPHEAAAEPEADCAALRALAVDPKVVGIGETGLDFHYDHSPRPRQAELFRAHCAATCETGLPLIVHSREADPETIQILREERPPSGVIHCFSTGKELAEAALEIGFYVSLAGIVTFKKAEGLRGIVRGLPLNRLLIETDAPYLA
ncbi:MAG: TatD family hydrolase, partial [Stellaceae bacterium]